MLNGVEMRNFLAFLIALFLLPVSAYAAMPDAGSNSSDPYGRNHSIGLGVGVTLSTAYSIANDVPFAIDYQYRFAPFYSMGAEATFGFKWYESTPDFKFYWIHAFHVFQHNGFIVSLQAGIGATYRTVSDDPVSYERYYERRAGFSMKADIVFGYRISELLSLKLKVDFQDQMTFGIAGRDVLHQFESSVQIITSFHF